MRVGDEIERGDGATGRVERFYTDNLGRPIAVVHWPDGSHTDHPFAGDGGWPCNDCGAETTPCDADGEPIEGQWEKYYVRPEVWEEAGLQSPLGGYLCIGCLEGRLGRKLAKGDFDPDHPDNEPCSLYSARLNERLEA